jgi:four helix bundle protein
MQQIDHERLDVYKVALEFLTFANRAAQGIPRGFAYLSDQLLRASTSIVLNIAEGAGKQSRADKRRYYLTARGSAGECAGVLDAMLHLEMLRSADFEEQKERLARIVAMLIKLAMSLERGRGHWGGEVVARGRVS